MGLRWLNQKRLIENIPTAKIRSLAMGLVEIVGKVIAVENNLLLSPFSNTKCVYYRYSVERWVKDGENHRWQTVNSGKRSLPFLLEDNTGKVLIDPVGAKIDIRSTTFNSGAGQDPPFIIKSYLASHSLDYEGFFGMNYKMRYREAVIVPKEKLYIIGSATDNPFKEDGSAQHSVDDIMIHKGNKQMYFISQKPEHKVIRSFQMKALGGLIGGGVIIIICFNILVNIFQKF